jgi:hypothetical protein
VGPPGSAVPVVARGVWPHRDARGAGTGGAGEESLRQLGFRELRVRHHGELARVEIARAELPRALTMEMLDAITAALKQAGFQYVTLDCSGFRSGSMNAVLPADVLRGAARRIAGSLESHLCDAYWISGVFFRHQRRHAAGRPGGCGRSLRRLAETAAALNVGARLEMRKVSRGGLAATKVDVITPGRGSRERREHSPHRIRHADHHEHPHEHMTHSHEHHLSTSITPTKHRAYARRRIARCRRFSRSFAAPL